MLKSIAVKNFTVFNDATFKFAPGLNVIIGENGVGKSHLLKLAYALLTSSFNAGDYAQTPNVSHDNVEVKYLEKLAGVFRVQHVSAFVRRDSQPQICEFSLEFSDPALNFSCEMKKGKEGGVSSSLPKPAEFVPTRSVYFPTRELLTIFPGFVALYDNNALQFEETWRDTCAYLEAPLLRGPARQKIASLLEPIEAALGGKVVVDQGVFFLEMADGGKLETHMLAEGHRKLAMLARLIANGMIVEHGYLFWDEPEANLNAKLIRVVAQVIAELSRRGVQIFVATHSFFLMKELGLLSKGNPIDMRYIGLSREEESPVIVVEQANKLSGLTQIVTLDEELAQYDRELELAHG